MKEKTPLINIVMGDNLLPDGSNLVENFQSNVIPQIGSEIITKKFKRQRVKNVIIQYTNIQEVEENRGGGFCLGFYLIPFLK